MIRDNGVIKNRLTNILIINSNMFGLLMKDQIRDNMQSSLIIT